jgi:hypothetical protein
MVKVKPNNATCQEGLLLVQTSTSLGKIRFGEMKGKIKAGIGVIAARFGEIWTNNRP